jgi:N-methylhydantoinase A
MRQHLDFFPKHDLVDLNDLWLMQSNGGVTPAKAAIENPLPTALSGPVAAVIGMTWISEQSGFNNAITFDVGGTSTDVALITNGVCQKNIITDIGGFSLKLPSIDVLSIGAGGGSIAFMAPDKRWHVGPDSAGALPGPACYGLGGLEPTLTDANLVLGRIPSALLGGALYLDKDAAFIALSKLGVSRNLDALQAAKDILRLATHAMCGAIRRVSVQKGYDPVDYTLCGVGGAGPMHAVEVAELLGMSTVFIPLDPGVTTAWGVYIADIEQEFSAAIGMLSGDICFSKIANGFSELVKRANGWASKHGINFEDCKLLHKLDLRYEGMTHESTIECEPPSDRTELWIGNAFDAFHSQFEEITGRVWRDKEGIEIVNLRISLISAGRKKMASLPLYQPDGSPPLVGRREVAFLASDELLDTPVYNRKSLNIGTNIVGPAIIEQADTTIILPPGWEAKVDVYGSFFITAA